MYLSTTSLFAFVQCLVFITANPIPNIDSLDTTLQARQVVAYYNSDDSGALYQPGTGVAGTQSFRDENGIYHDITRRSKDATEAKPRAESAASGASELLRARARTAFLQFLTNTNSKRTVEDVQEAQSIARRDGEDQTAPAGILKKIGDGEKIYF